MKNDLPGRVLSLGYFNNEPATKISYRYLIMSRHLIIYMIYYDK